MQSDQNLPPAVKTAPALPPPTQVPRDGRPVPSPSEATSPPGASQSEGHSRGIESWVTAAAARPQMIVQPRGRKQLVSITCAFGGATVTVGFHVGQSPFLILPGAGTWEWILGPQECLLAATTADTVVTGVARDV